MRVMSYNTLFGGLDGTDDGRYQLQVGIIRKERPDILLLQEAKAFPADGSKRLFETERHLGMRGFVAVAPATGQHTAIFIRPDLRPLHFDVDCQHFHHAAALLKLAVPGDDRVLTVASVHLCPNSPHVRAREASYLYNLADPDGLSLIGGDFNSVSPDDPEPEGLSELPARYRMRYTREDGTADRSTLSALLRAGFIDVGHRLSPSPTPTVPGRGFDNTEFVPFRSDYFLTTATLAGAASAYSVIRNDQTDIASDHYPICADFELGHRHAHAPKS
ncbi:endonuclease/exonuclease/phosphatase family protein (plasmid) [Agrobacterium tumefaciens]|uniref:Endonuclease/exonuclease/phosphatase family protein n=1 Tax=Agrobacterium tumefaciens TaxID=358 RepID=A0AAJ4N8E2_AGRTU|nr:endonuclease/exonuclease/phosphatase family protein [Agrobacterium tumefaciens]